MTSPQPLAQPKLILGEGQEEVLFFSALISHLNISDIQIEQYQGKANLARYIKALPIRSGYSDLKAIGITRDADNNSIGAFQSICDNLRSANLPVPNMHAKFVGTNPKVGIFILPDGSSSGMLESLCLLFEI